MEGLLIPISTEPTPFRNSASKVAALWEHTITPAYYLLHETQVNFCKLPDEPTKPKSVILVAIVTEEGMLSSAQFTNEL